MNLQNTAVIKNSQVLGSTPLHRPFGIILHERALSSAVQRLLYYWKEEKKRLKVGPSRYNYYCVPTKDQALIRDLAFIFVIMLFPLATKQDQVFI